jgi:O-antigen/teichoic acid export membrane protein
LVVGYAAGGALYLVALQILGHWLEGCLYGGKFSAETGVLLVLGIWAFAVCISNALGVVCRAAQRPNVCFVALVAACMCSVLTTYPLIRYYGLPGAALSMALTYVVSAAIPAIAYFYNLKFRRRQETGHGPVCAGKERVAECS